MRDAPGARRQGSLTAREREVLLHVADGATNRGIADALDISEKTVKSHLTRIYRKLEVANRTQAAAKAIREKIVGDGER